ncbi:hypothetical protein Bca52824_011140 [Brassica carinata]|uniref:Uncharacterized protein n=1 Tax=Brassica carinata TaxID=52824 RepID=A0A8X7WFQ4_BRACI|nr:hypothetical protein Bca52824_011140 [Brassica carinata]
MGSFPWNLRTRGAASNKLGDEPQGSLASTEVVTKEAKLKKISQPLLGKKPPRKPKTRPRTVQKQMNVMVPSLFPAITQFTIVKDEGDQRAINTSHVQAKSNENGIGFVKLLGRYRVKRPFELLLTNGYSIIYSRIHSYLALLLDIFIPGCWLTLFPGLWLAEEVTQALMKPLRQRKHDQRCPCLLEITSKSFTLANL